MGWFCCDEKYHIKDYDTIERIIMTLSDLSDRDKLIMRNRFKRISLYVNRHFQKISKCYNWSKLFIICAGVINPALLSIQQGNSIDYLFWIVWGTQLGVSIATALQSFYKWDKKYFLFHSYRTKIIQEMWLFLELTGPYESIDVESPSTHKNQLNEFLLRIEVIYRKLKDSSLELETQNDDVKKHNSRKKDESSETASNPDRNNQNYEDKRILFRSSDSPHPRSMFKEHQRVHVRSHSFISDDNRRNRIQITLHDTFVLEHLADFIQQGKEYISKESLEKTLNGRLQDSQNLSEKQKNKLQASINSIKENKEKLQKNLEHSAKEIGSYLYDKFHSDIPPEVQRFFQNKLDEQQTFDNNIKSKFFETIYNQFQEINQSEKEEELQ